MSRSAFALEDDPVAVAQPRFAWQRWLAYAVVALCCTFVFWHLDPGLAPWRFDLGRLFSDTTPNGGDMGAHVWWPAFLRDNWFGQGRLAGWAPDWYAGFPVGQFYFPLPAVAIVAVDLILPYNVAFKLVTVTGPVMLPAAAYYFARGVRFPWPAPPLFAIASVRYLFEIRHVDGDNTWTIYGGNLAGVLAGEFSFTLALSFALFFLGALGRTLDTGRRPWLPAALLAATVTSHLIVALFAAVLGVGVWLIRRPTRTYPVAAAIAGVAFLLTAVWTLPLLFTQSFTQSMRYGKVTEYSNWLTTFPWWLWLLIFVAVVAAAWWRRPTTLMLLGAAVVFGLFFAYWPTHHVWNTRFLPFYFLTIAFLGAVGAAEIIRHATAGFVWVVDWVRGGEVEIADGTDEAAVVPAHADEHGGASPHTTEPTEPTEPVEPVVSVPAGSAEAVDRRRNVILGAVSASLVACFAVGTLWWVNENRGVVPGWSSWNYSGYESKPAWPEYRNLIATMDELGREQPGRALWEPSSDINQYGTTLALELLPYWTDGRVGSMEGLYFESSGTTDYHFLTVSELAAEGNPSNPVRGLVYGNLTDFDLGVRHLQMLGVTYYLTQSEDAARSADAHPDLTLVGEVGDTDGAAPDGWRIYEVADAPLVEGLDNQPVVVSPSGGTTSECFGTDQPETGSEPHLDSWECAAAPWWRDPSALDVAFAADGPDEWQRVEVDQLAAADRRPLPPVTVTDVVEEPDEISFSVDQVGVPVVVKASYFPNWTVSGAEGPWRLSPNLMVVVPTETEVTLNYSTTSVEWLGRLATLLGIVGLVLLAQWRPRSQWLALAGEGPRDHDQPDTSPRDDVDTVEASDSPRRPGGGPEAGDTGTEGAGEPALR